MKHIELMAPAGSYESLMAAINAGANAVYFGIEQLNMRARSSNNFTVKDLKKIVSICNKHNVRSYVTLNTILYDHDMELMKKICDAVKDAGATAIIASDIAAILYAREKGITVHISTQTNVSNMETVTFYAQFADAIVLARELTLQQIEHICNQIKEKNICGPNGTQIKIEVFAHGALCIAIAGKCHMSLTTTNASANRGACMQSCRKSYKVIDEEDGHELRLENKYVMSPKDICTIGFLDRFINAGVSILKIEGRGRGPEYVQKTVQCYREALDAIEHGTYTKEKIADWIKELETVYNRGFWHGGYYLGKEIDMWSKTYGSKATKEKQQIGIVKNYYPKSKIAHIKLESGTLKVNDTILIIGPTTGIIEERITIMQNENGKTTSAKKGDEITTPILQKVRENDKVYIFIERESWQK